MRRFSWILIPMLVACGTPQENCIGVGMQDIRTLDRLIAETERNIDRGFDYVEVESTALEWQDCSPKPTPEIPTPAEQICQVPVVIVERVPVAIDEIVERRKLVSLRAKKAQRETEVPSMIASCRARYPNVGQ